jgi:uncharacterized lipoprotein YajG
MMTRRSVLLVGVTAAMLGGCAFTTSTLNVRYEEARAARGPLSSVEPRRVEIVSVVDKRPDTARIGYKRNGFNQQTADILSGRPVSEVIRDALIVELKKNGHLFEPSERDLRLAVDVTDFWFDLRVGMWTIEYLGTAGIALTVNDGRNGATLLSQRYQSSHREERAAGYEGTWEAVMNAALERMMRDVATDPRLVEAFRPR